MNRQRKAPNLACIIFIELAAATVHAHLTNLFKYIRMPWKWTSILHVVFEKWLQWLFHCRSWLGLTLNQYRLSTYLHSCTLQASLLQAIFLSLLKPLMTRNYYTKHHNKWQKRTSKNCVLVYFHTKEWFFFSKIKIKINKCRLKYGGVLYRTLRD